MIRIYLIRHGETVYNAQGRIQGQRDIELTQLGRSQAKAAALRLSSEPITAVYSSDLRRASDTAQAIARYHGLPVQERPELRERGLGVLEGLTMPEVESRFPSDAHPWRLDKAAAPPDGETADDVVRRCGSFSQRVLSEHGGSGGIVVVGHFGSVRGVVKALCPDLPDDRLRFSNASISVLEVGEICTAVLLDDTSHLEQAQVTINEADSIAG